MVFMMGFGIILVLVLSAVAITLWRRVWIAERIQREKAAEQLNNEARMNHIYDSLHVLASSVLNDQLRIAEAGIRMAILLDNINLTCAEKHLLSSITEIYNRTRHIPTHERLTTLDKTQRRQYEKELREIESELSASIKEAAQYITQPDFRERRPLH